MATITMLLVPSRGHTAAMAVCFAPPRFETDTLCFWIDAAVGIHLLNSKLN